MPSAVTHAPYRSVPLEPPRKQWSRIECEALEAAGLLTNERVELVDGELVSKMGKKRSHVITVTLVAGWLVRVFGERFVNQEAPIDVAPEDNPTNEPEPDVILLNRSFLEFRTSNPCPPDLRLVVEVSESTLGFDLTKKSALYARARIPEYWVLDVLERRLIVHRDPEAGQYRTIAAYSEHESVTPLAAPDKPFPVSEAFGS